MGSLANYLVDALVSELIKKLLSGSAGSLS